MKVWLIDDERPCLDELAWLLKQYPDIEVAGMDTDPVAARRFIVASPPDAVFLDIDMPRLDGLELALSLQEQCPGLIVIFVTAHAQYALDAYKAHPADFLLKPVRRARLDDCVSHLRKHYALLHPNSPAKRTLFLRCFGAFELICDTEVKWSTRRVKELLLYLIDKNGSPASKEELLEALFGGKSDRNTVHNLHMTTYRLKALLDTLDPERSRLRLTDDYALIIAPGVCDFTDFMRFAKENAVITERNMKEAEHALSLFRGPYHEKERYDWATESAHEADVEYERIALGLSSCYIRAGRMQEAKRTLGELLSRNALCEEAHALLLDVALQSNDREGYLVQYEQYARILQKELRLKPAARYLQQYEQLKRSRSR